MSVKITELPLLSLTGRHDDDYIEVSHRDTTGEYHSYRLALADLITQVVLTTTPLLPLTEGRAQLPSQPIGTLVNNLAFVQLEDDSWMEVQGVSVLSRGDNWYVELPETDLAEFPSTPVGVIVCYLARN